MFKRRGQNSNDNDPADEVALDDGLVDAEPESDEADGDEIEELAEDMTADLDSQAADFFADNDVWMYGPNATAVVEILDWLEEITPVEARPLSEAWLAIPKSDRDRARKAARKLAENDTEIERHLQLAREAATTTIAAATPGSSRRVLATTRTQMPTATGSTPTSRRGGESAVSRQFTAASAASTASTAAGHPSLLQVVQDVRNAVPVALGYMGRKCSTPPAPPAGG